MPEENKERNKLFIKSWKEEELSNRELQEKFNLSPGGVKSFKTRLRKKDPSLYIKPLAGKLANQQVSKPEKKATSKELYETVTYYITKEQKQRVKLLALEQDKEISQLIREVLSEYFNRH